MGFFAIGIYHTKTEFNVGTLFRSAVNFGASHVFTIGRRYKRKAADTVNTPNQIPVYNYNDIDDLKAHLPMNCPLIGVELDDRAQPLDSYTHLENAVYLLGAEDHGIPPRELAKCHSVVQIPYTASCLNVAVAGSILLYDRSVKMANRHNSSSAYYVSPRRRNGELYDHQMKLIGDAIETAKSNCVAPDFYTTKLGLPYQPPETD